jgi:hypothetical protein
MNVLPAHLGFSVADGERVSLTFEAGDLLLRFTDWHEQPITHRFLEALAFRWSSEGTVATPRDDATYEVASSSWITSEVEADGHASSNEFAHYVLCFNTAKVLEVICRRHP